MPNLEFALCASDLLTALLWIMLTILVGFVMFFVGTVTGWKAKSIIGRGLLRVDGRTSSKTCYVIGSDILSSDMDLSIQHTVDRSAVGRSE